MSLDGFIAGPGEDVAWLTEHLGPNPAIDDVIGKIGALLVGHRTFRGNDAPGHDQGRQAVRRGGRADHFTCFSVVHLPGTPAFAPPASVTLTDQFFGHSTAVGAPNLLCSPTSKVIVPPTGTPIVNPSHSLVCFVIPASPAFTSRIVYAKNQFGIGAEAVIANRELCVPSILG